MLPGYNTIGIWAPILLVAARILQGLSTGGEYVGAMTYVVERAPDHKRGMMVGFLPLGNLVGFVLAGLLVTALQTWLPERDMLTWGWRIPLLLGAPFGLVALYLRLRLEESPAYEDASDSAHASGDHGWQQFRRTVVEQWRRLLICAALVLTSQVADFMLTGYLPTYLRLFVRVGHTAGLVMIVVTLAILMATVVFVAKLSDRIGVKPIMWRGVAGPGFGVDGDRGHYVCPLDDGHCRTVRTGGHSCQGCDGRVRSCLRDDGASEGHRG